MTDKTDKTVKTAMIAWTDELIAHVNSFSRAALSYMGQDGYPVTLPLPFTFDPATRRFTLPTPVRPPACSATSGGEDTGQIALTLLRFDPQVANERYLLFYGQLAAHDESWSFTPSRVVLP
jgi:hypothetical protein